MPDLDLYYARSGNSLRAAIALELSGVPYKRHELDLARQQQKSESFLALNPAGHVPVMIVTRPDGRAALPQSGAIMDYLLRQHRPDLYPVDEIARASCTATFLAALSDLAIPNALARYLSAQPEAARFVLDRMLADLRALFRPVETTRFLCGDAVTIADYAHFPVLYMREARLRSEPDYGHVLRWLDRMKADPAVTRAVAFSGLQIEG
jgi:GST-like protein